MSTLTDTPTPEADAVLRALDEPPVIKPPTVNGVEQQLVGVQTAAAMMGVSVRTMWRWIEAGRVRGLKLGDATMRIPVADLNKLAVSA
ncbi:helix-turn-helix domain-containing protein [Mycobacteroides abscessus]|nr:helix-turn-helix domain-containing protein [Mycobacteroides abscessus]